MSRIIRSLIAMTTLVLAWPAAGAELSGVLEAGAGRVLSVPVSGVVADVAVEVGDRVKQGDTLLALDPRVFRAELQRADAVLAEQDEVLAEARREWERAQELYDRTVMSERDLQLAKNAFLAAQAGHRTAQAERTRAAWELEMSRLKAPVDGRIQARHIHPGQVVITRERVQPLLELVPAGDWRVRLVVPGSSAYTAGEAVRIRVQDHQYSGRIGQRIPPADRGEEAALVVEFSAPESAGLQTGQPARVVLP